MYRTSSGPAALAASALIAAACVAQPPETSPTRPPPLPFVYRTPYVVKAPLPPRFAVPLPHSLAALTDAEALPPAPWLRHRLQRGDGEVGARLLSALGQAAAAGRLPPELADAFDRAIGYEPSAAACALLADGLERVPAAAARRWLWGALARCVDLRWAPWFARPAAPDQAVVEWFAAGGRRDRTPTPRLERAAVAQAQRGDWAAARRVGFALANLRGDAAWQTLALVQRRLAQAERRAIVAIGFADRPEPRARRLLASACAALRRRWEPVCDDDRGGIGPATLAEQVRRWDLPTPELVDTWQFDAVLAAAAACVDEADDEGIQVRCLERVAQLDWSRATAIARRIRRGRLDYPYARELLAGLRRFADAGALVERLREAGLPSEVVAARQEPAISARDLLLAHGRGLVFDSETDQFPNEHDGLAARLSELVRPALDGVVFEERPPLDEQRPYRLRAYLDGRLLEVDAQNLGDWYDLEAVLGLLNSLLRRQHSPLRLITLASGDQSAFVAAGDAEALAALASEDLLVVGAAAGAVENGQAAERQLLERLERDAPGGVFDAQDTE